MILYQGLQFLFQFSCVLTEHFFIPFLLFFCSGQKKTFFKVFFFLLNQRFLNASLRRSLLIIAVKFIALVVEKNETFAFENYKRNLRIFSETLLSSVLILPCVLIDSMIHVLEKTRSLKMLIVFTICIFLKSVERGFDF